MIVNCELRLYKDEIAPEAVATLDTRGVTAIYIVSGGLRVRTGGFGGVVGANSAFYAPDMPQLSGGSFPTMMLRWQLARAGARDATATGVGVTGSQLLAAPMQLDTSKNYLLRCDRVDFPPNGEALTHTHSGGGIRCLLFGGIAIHTKDEVHHYAPHGAWFEAGPDPVYATTLATDVSAFARVMILPRELLGKSSITYVNAEDIDKPKTQKYQVFIDTPIELPK